MLSKIEHSVDEYIRIRKCIERCLDDAGRAERYLSKPHNRNVPSMYQLIETSYLSNPSDEKFLINPINQKKIASGILRGIKLYNANVKKEILK